ncbi:DUF1284 domain-containing protein [Ethanoligenens harbinense]|uniref:DUF1284 domain-containing protein n=1 Tax=Ethanoligenens harbinense (strain DSM 18485 / JCM 12961 / CGMCC 1.5033 / YUAN-3) TaxID=663278 RepID=E6U9W0_ETHHY|nr:protein of unknown function DUF1284 [Ethanoligenens harbinense YUAN-3]AVQ95362.1 DUF1284 domain-containing protein [Ethanoligenens harbinense YUAN-3]AYF38028.1 DUF1284 domain-containing protein [Ethanoligenens harbinense]AYF40773.1 DUF1284 domain-containing protein [Ethanoligenens harbinense]QCN91604.1 DUF1284 domain-containing protein [Ethanoligenens harbinense]
MFNYKLHPHHGVCIAFFEGKGYSPSFIQNMQAVINLLDNSAQIQLVTGKDVICSECPNIRNNQCIHQKTVVRFDRAVLAACHLHAGQILKWTDFKQMVFSHIISRGTIRSICGGCQWEMLCHNKADKLARMSI